MRRAMKGRLPDDVLCRDKTPLRSDPFALAAHNRPIPALDSIELREFVRPERIPKHWDGNSQKSERLANLCALWFWLTEDRR